jgi:hypothetical protein
MPHKGDWVCPKCNFLIYGSKNQCKKCKTYKPGFIYQKSISSIYKEISDNNIIKEKYLMDKAINEGRPEKYYITNCRLCKNEFNPKTHNCWKYS